jgi:ParB-like chromosome segregation protein Spo0J
MKEWAVSQTITRNIDDIVPYDSNPRVHSPKQIDQVANSIKEFGWTMPVLIDDKNEIIAGHGRVLAAKKLGIKEVPCILASGWSEEKKKAYCIADNKLTENSVWESDFLKLNIEFLKDNDFDLRLTGFDMSEIDKIIGEINFDTSEQDLTNKCEIIVELSDTTKQEQLYEELTERGYKCRVLSF